MKLLGAGLGLLLAAGEEAEEIKKALARTGELKSYFYQWEVVTTSGGRPRRVSGAGEYVAPDVVTLRTGVLEIAKKGSRALVKGKDGWAAPAEGDRAGELAGNLKPPHEAFAPVLARLSKPARGKDQERQGAPCRVIRGEVSGEPLKEAVRGVSTNFETFEALIDWEASRASVEVWIGAKDGRLVRVALEGSLKLALEEKAGPIPYARNVEILEPGAAKLSLSADVRRKLGIED